MVATKESIFRSKLIKRIKSEFDNCDVLYNDPKRKQGVPDLIILCNDKWAMLETKKDRTSSKRPNQPHYIDKYNAMSFATFVSPDNEEEVLNGLQQTFGTRR